MTQAMMKNKTMMVMKIRNQYGTGESSSVCVFEHFESLFENFKSLIITSGISILHKNKESWTRNFKLTEIVLKIKLSLVLSCSVLKFHTEFQYQTKKIQKQSYQRQNYQRK